MSVFEGYLKKKHTNTSVLMRNWNTRYFTLLDDKLEYKKKEDDDRDRGAWDLQEVLSIGLSAEAKEKGEDQATEFEIVLPERTLVLKAQTAQLAREWITNLRKTVDRMQGDPYPTPNGREADIKASGNGFAPSMRGPGAGFFNPDAVGDVVARPKAAPARSGNVSPRSLLARPSIIDPEFASGPPPQRFRDVHEAPRERRRGPSGGAPSRPSARNRALSAAEEEVLSFDNDVDDDAVMAFERDSPPERRPLQPQRRSPPSDPPPQARGGARRTEAQGREWLEDDWDSSEPDDY